MGFDSFYFDINPDRYLLLKQAAPMSARFSRTSPATGLQELRP